MEFGTRSTPRSGGGGFAHTHRGRRAHLKVGDGKTKFGERPTTELEIAFPCPLSFYEDLPNCDIGLEDFETLAVERLKLMRAIEKVGSLGMIKYSKDWLDKMDEELRRSDLLAVYSYDALNCLKARERDHVSHYILRLAFCAKEDQRRWLTTQETDLFRYRCMKAGDLRDFVAARNLDYASADEEELRRWRPVLEGLAYVATRTFYKVPFTEALELVRTRKVLVSNGYCFVPDTDMTSLVAAVFRAMLTQALAFTSKMLPQLNEDERMVQALGDLGNRYTGADYSQKEGDGPTVTAEMIPDLAHKHFPTCMRTMQNTLSSTHHLKYKGRLQYGLFLKGIGLSLQDAIRFFRGEFTRGPVDVDKFDKEYVYGIRYNYGQEGKKVNWTPWNCMRIIMENVGPGENHGCPFRHSDPDALRETLAKSGLADSDSLGKIVQLAKDGHYQKACALEYSAQRKGVVEISSGGIVNHPNQYYSESIGGGAGGSAVNRRASNLKTERANLYKSKDEMMLEEEFTQPMEESEAAP